MDDYQMIFDMELLSAAKMVPMPHLRISLHGASGNTEKRQGQGRRLQLNKGPQHGDRMDLVVPEALVPVLEEFAGTTPAKLPRWRPPRHKVGHAPTELKKLTGRRRGSIEFRAGDQVLVKLDADRAGIFRGQH
ncbi:hypothetical protein EJ110_NYTH29202 [Nymphaea thermarum]|nr:hypothetical protein EJ110_NYTH29202 [Nymphaea thermarum]